MSLFKQEICTLIFLISSSISYGQDENALLVKAYNARSLTQLDSFFKYWAAKTSPRSGDKIFQENDTVRNIYELYQSFYNPRDVKRIGGSEWSDSIYKNVKYLLVQNKVFYVIVDTLDKALIINKAISKYSKADSNWLLKEYRSDTLQFERDYLEWPIAKHYDTLLDFRPELSFLNIKSIILIDRLDSLFNRFLGNSHYMIGSGSIDSPARSKGESYKRKKFLENFIKIWYGHWGGYWQLHSYPYVSKITFDKRLENAIIDYRMVYEGGYAYLKKIGGVWTLIEARRTWIE